MKCDCACGCTKEVQPDGLIAHDGSHAFCKDCFYGIPVPGSPHGVPDRIMDLILFEAEAYEDIPPDCWPATSSGKPN